MLRKWSNFQSWKYYKYKTAKNLEVWKEKEIILSNDFVLLTPLSI